MKGLFIVLALIAVSSAQFGPSQVVLERTWTIEGEDGEFIDFEGALAVNGSGQRIVSLEVGPGSFHTDEQGTVLVRYRGNMSGPSLEVKGRAILDIDYETDILTDRPLPGNALEATALTSSDQRVLSQALSLSEPNSSLKTAMNLVNWVNGHVDYDTSYWDEVKSAEEVFTERRGVCVEYTHLLISMARSLGFKTRYVSGYALADDWQPHAWAEIEIPGYGWLPADATFGQLGELDSTHVAVSYGDDQLSAYDVLLTMNRNSTLRVDDEITELYSSSDPGDVSVSIDLDDRAYLFDVALMNNGKEYVFGKHSFKLPPEIGGEASSVVLLGPGETAHRYHGMNYSFFDGSDSYDVRVSASFNDAAAEKSFIFDGNHQSCAAAFALLSLLSLKILSW